MIGAAARVAVPLLPAMRSVESAVNRNALGSKPWGALEFTPGLACPAPNMRGLGVMMANGIACGVGSVTAGLALSLDVDQSGRHANVVDIAEHVLQGL